MRPVHRRAPPTHGVHPSQHMRATTTRAQAPHITHGIPKKPVTHARGGSPEDYEPPLINTPIISKKNGLRPSSPTMKSAIPGTLWDASGHEAALSRGSTPGPTLPVSKKWTPRKGINPADADRVAKESANLSARSICANMAKSFARQQQLAAREQLEIRARLDQIAASFSTASPRATMPWRYDLRVHQYDRPRPKTAPHPRRSREAVVNHTTPCFSPRPARAQEPVELS